LTKSWPALSLAFNPGTGDAGADCDTTLQDLVSATLDGLDVVAVSELPDGAWHVFFRSEDQRRDAASAIQAAHGHAGLEVHAIDVPDEDWARRSQAALGAVRVGRVVVAPPWDALAATPEPDSVTIIIEPAMGFGSGHHATTRLCLAALQRLELRARRVLDIGTGSGVLALAAARLGAREVLAIDIDADALENARGNAALNGHPPGVEFRACDFRRATSLSADIVLANLTGGMLIAGASDIIRMVAPGGVLVLSGVTLEERVHVLAAFSWRARIEWTSEEDGWCCVSLRADG
jgi:ribosomal protein L11 methyltransferase